MLNSVTGKIEIKHLTSEQAKNTEHFKDKESGGELEVQEKLPLLEWFANNYKKFGCQLEFVTNKCAARWHCVALARSADLLKTLCMLDPISCVWHVKPLPCGSLS